MAEPLPELTGERLRLRPGTLADVDSVHRVRCDPTVVRWWNAGTREETVEQVLNTEPNTYFFVIETNAGPVAGGIQFYEEPNAQFHYRPSTSSWAPTSRAAASVARRWSC